jgi:uncharacterized protein (DUF362 family)
MSLVSFVNVRESTTNSMKQAVLESTDLIDYSFSKKTKTVVIKPNMCYYWDYSTGHTTDPKFVAALIELLREQISQDVKISIVESDASAMQCKYAFKFLGYEKLANEYNVSLINLSEDKSDIIEVMVGGQPFDLAVPRTIQNADLKINIPKIKFAMQKIKVTCALKNIYGCNPYPQKFKYHPKLGETIVALNKAMKFDLCLIDGNIVAGRSTRKLGLVMASRDPVAIDFAAAKIAGVNPNSISYFRLAHREGLGNTSFIPKGVSLNHFKELYPSKSLRDKMLSQALRLLLKVGLGRRLGLS